MKEQIAKLKLEQLMYDEERQRLRADAAEKYRLQLENFVDMICHEIRNPYAFHQFFFFPFSLVSSSFFEFLLLC
jgi:hypothetical protein